MVSSSKLHRKSSRRACRSLAPYIAFVLLLPSLEIYFRRTTDLPRIPQLYRKPLGPHALADDEAHGDAVDKVRRSLSHRHVPRTALTTSQVQPGDADALRTLPSRPLPTVAHARLIVLTYKRATSLQRLLDSLVAATYLDDRVDLDIWIDRSHVKHGEGQINQQVRAVADNLSWPHGVKTVYARRQHGGLYAQWLHTWNVSEAVRTGEFALILEDDLEVSPAFYVWLRTARQRYAKQPDVGAFTLQRLRLRNRKPASAGHPSYISLPRGTHAFKYRLQGSWGFAPEPARWHHFLQWYAAMRRDERKPYVDGLLTTAWYKGQERRAGLDYAPTMWTQWWVKYANEHGYFTVTPWLDGGKTLCANWKEPGLHFFGKSKGADFPIYRGSPDSLVWPPKLLALDWDGLPIESAT